MSTPYLHQITSWYVIPVFCSISYVNVFNMAAPMESAQIFLFMFFHCNILHCALCRLYLPCASIIFKHIGPNPFETIVTPWMWNVRLQKLSKAPNFWLRLTNMYKWVLARGTGYPPQQNYMEKSNQLHPYATLKHAHIMHNISDWNY